MSKNLVIVESPAKAKTIEKYLGKDFKVLASYGHVRDLIGKNDAVDPTDNFAMKYEVQEEKESKIQAIVKELKKADALYLATDPDREGEAISWHLHEILQERDLIGDKNVHRVVFYEITKSAVQEAIDNPRHLAADLIAAQQARRAIDHLVGFNLSPLLWKKIKPGLSAGRVQSPALRLLCEREDEIDKFVPQEYWKIEADCKKSSEQFIAKLTHYQGHKLDQFDINTDVLAQEAHKTLSEASNGQLLVGKIDKKERKSNPPPPFTTSTLQQRAVSYLKFSAKRTMSIAQRLYEAGHITYMRTDSVTLSNDAITEIRHLIENKYGKDNLPDSIRIFKTKSKNAQEAHEAIRPTSTLKLPEQLKGELNEEQYKLYDLIWKRTVASQMVHAVYDQVAIELHAGSPEHVFRANGSSIKVKGFTLLDQQDRDNILPPMEVGDSVDLQEIRCEQHFTSPPSRYTEASLVKALEEYGIGRPSTYASIIDRISSKQYAEIENRTFFPTDMGRLLNRFLTKHFTQYVDYDFTAHLEDELDEISRGEKAWIPVMESFWTPFESLVKDKEVSVTREEAIEARDLGTHPKSGKPISVRMGRYGPFVQIGTKEDEEKPLFAGLMPGQKMDKITLEEALELFKLPRDLGETPEGEKVLASVGRFGPYVKYGSKYVSIKGEDPYTIELDLALEFIAKKKEEDANKFIKEFEEEDIQVLNGRYGPYITDGNKNAKIPKDIEPDSLNLEQCLELLAAAPVRKGRGKKKVAKKKVVRKKAAPKKKTAKKKTAKKKTAKKKTAPKKKAAKKTDD